MLFFPQHPPWQGDLHIGLGLSGVNLNLGGSHSQQHGHIQGHWHLPAGGFFWQHSQHGLFTHAPNVTGKFSCGQQPQPSFPQAWGHSNPPQQLPQPQPSPAAPQQPHRFPWPVHALVSCRKLCHAGSDVMQHAKYNMQIYEVSSCKLLYN